MADVRPATKHINRGAYRPADRSDSFDHTHLLMMPSVHTWQVAIIFLNYKDAATRTSPPHAQPAKQSVIILVLHDPLHLQHGLVVRTLSRDWALPWSGFEFRGGLTPKTLGLAVSLLPIDYSGPGQVGIGVLLRAPFFFLHGLASGGRDKFSCSHAFFEPGWVLLPLHTAASLA